MHTFINTDFLSAAEASLHVSDLSIQRGYGVFDFFKTVKGRPIFLEDHLDRFFGSAARLRMTIPQSRATLKATITQLQQLNNIPDSGIRLTLTGGYASDGYTLSEPNLIITQKLLSAPMSETCPPAIRLITYPHQRQLPEAKTIDYLVAILVQPRIHDAGADDVLYHHEGVLTECPRSNFFIVTPEGVLATPARDMLKGITRKKVLALAAAAGIPIETRDVRLDEISTAREAFITSTTRGIMPVHRVDNMRIGHTAAASAIPAFPITAALCRQLYNLVFSMI